MADTSKIRLTDIASSIGKKLFSPTHAYRAIRLHRNRRTARVNHDAQLALYSQIIGDYLHLGYFDEPSLSPEEISLGAIRRAQTRYAQIIMESIRDFSAPILDVGCGMGGLLKDLQKKGAQTVGLTPDKHQVTFLKERVPGAIWHTRFEDVATGELCHQFGTVITAESVQYIDKRKIFEKIRASLAPSGRWILCDYLKRSDSNSSKPSWEFLVQGFNQHGFQIVRDQDITKNILPTVRFLQYLGDRFAIPIFDFIDFKIQSREPGFHYLLSETLAKMRQILENNLSIVNSDRFLEEKSYRLIVVDRP